VRGLALCSNSSDSTTSTCQAHSLLQDSLDKLDAEAQLAAREVRATTPVVGDECVESVTALVVVGRSSSVTSQLDRVAAVSVLFR